MKVALSIPTSPERRLALASLVLTRPNDFIDTRLALCCVLSINLRTIAHPQ